jgi:hypothetical protein
VPPPIASHAALAADLDRLADLLEVTRFELEVPAQAARRVPAERASALVRHYLLPRIAAPDAPLVVAVFGPTGAGKSTLLNSLAGRPISDAGALRPTTRRPVVWRRAGARPAMPASLSPLVVEDDHPLLDHMILVDTPDLDSYLVEHRRVAEEVLRSADAAVFVTTPQRYADAVPAEVVSELAARRLPLLTVANRLSRRSSGAVTDLAGLLRDHGIHDARTDDIVQIQEHRLKADGRLPRAAIDRVRSHLEDLASERAEVVSSAVGGAVAAVCVDAITVAGAIRAQHEEGEGLWLAARLGYEHQLDEIALHLEQGDLVRGEVVARWQRMVGVGDLAALIARGWARVRDVVGGRTLQPEQMQRVSSEARKELVDLALVRCQRAVTAAVTAWEIEPGARALIDERLRRPDEDFEKAVEAEVDAWLAGLIEMIAEQGKSRFRLARMASVGINAAATVLLLGVFAHTGGLTGAEMGVAAGTAAAQQTVLEHLFGTAASTALGRRARRDLVARLDKAMSADASRFRRAIEAATDPSDRAEKLAELVKAIRRDAEVAGYD